MILDTKEQRETIISLINSVNWPGSELEKALALKTAVKTAPILPPDKQVKHLAPDEDGTKEE